MALKFSRRSGQLFGGSCPHLANGIEYNVPAIFALATALQRRRVNVAAVAEEKLQSVSSCPFTKWFCRLGTMPSQLFGIGHVYSRKPTRQILDVSASHFQRALPHGLVHKRNAY